MDGLCWVVFSAQRQMNMRDLCFGHTHATASLAEPHPRVQAARGSGVMGLYQRNVMTLSFYVRLMTYNHKRLRLPRVQRYIHVGCFACSILGGWSMKRDV